MSRKTNHLWSLAFCLVAVVLSLTASPLLAQISTATITGTVSDTTGAVLPGVEVTITNIDNGQTRLAISGDEGRIGSMLDDEVSGPYLETLCSNLVQNLVDGRRQKPPMPTLSVLG